jgi:hypothetical protein
MRFSTSCAVLALLLLTWPATRAGEGKGDDELRGRILKAWKRQREEIVTAKIKLKRYRWVASTGAPALLDPNGYARVQDDLRKSTPAQAYAAIMELLKGGEEQQFLIWVDGQDLRNDGDRETLILKGGKELLYSKGNRQITQVPGKSGWERLGVEKLRLAPFVGGDVTIDQLLIEGREGGNIKLRFGRWSLLAVEATGDILQGRWNTDNGIPYADRFQINEAVAGIEGAFPRFSMRLEYDDGKLAWADVYLIEEATLNEPINPEVFTLGAPKGTIFIDKTQPGRPVRVFKEDVKSVASLGDPPSTTPSRPLWVYIAYGAGALLVVAAILLLTRRRSTA